MIPIAMTIMRSTRLAQRATLEGNQEALLWMRGEKINFCSE